MREPARTRSALPALAGAARSLADTLRDTLPAADHPGVPAAVLTLTLRTALIAILEAEALIHARGTPTAARARYTTLGPAAGSPWPAAARKLRAFAHGDADLGVRPARSWIWSAVGVPDLSSARLPAAAWAPLSEAIAAWTAHHPDAFALGSAYEHLLAALAPGDQPNPRRRAGVFYTPRPLVDHALDTALRTPISASTTVCDPACGSGNFLVAAAERLAATLPRSRAARRVFGVDIDPIAAGLCRFSLWRFAGRPGSPWDWVNRQVITGDALADPSPDPWSRARRGGPPTLTWARAFPAAARAGGFTALVGNPPFLNQLRTATAASRERAATLAAWSRGAVGGYTDAAAAFLLRGMTLLAPGGRLAMVQPQSTLSARDAGPVRRAILALGVPESLWAAERSEFPGAAVLACILSARRCGPAVRAARVECRDSLTRAVRTQVTIPRNTLAQAPTWSVLLARARGVPELPQTAGPAGGDSGGGGGGGVGGVLGDIATATADFRDEYYGLRGLLVDARDADEALFPRLITSGLIDAARTLWGEASTRIFKRAWSCPRVDLRDLRAGPLAGWAERRLVPKVLLATQTRVLEAVADEGGRWLPLTPVVTIAPRDPADLWRIAAVLLSPVASAAGLERTAGSALSAGALKLSAREAALLPLPTRRAAWDRAADAARRAHANDAGPLDELAALSAEAYGLTGAAARKLLAWWRARRGPRTPRGAPAAG